MSQKRVWILGGGTFVAGAAVLAVIASGLLQEPDRAPQPPVAPPLAQPADTPLSPQSPIPAAPTAGQAQAVPNATAQPSAAGQPVPDPGVVAPPPEPPRFDVVRVARDGETLVAGSAAPGSAVVLRVDGAIIAQTVADPAGQFVALFSLGYSEAAQSMTLEAEGADGVVLAADGTVILTPRAAPVALAQVPAAPPDGPLDPAAQDATRQDPTGQVLAAQGGASPEAASDPAAPSVGEDNVALALAEPPAQPQPQVPPPTAPQPPAQAVGSAAQTAAPLTAVSAPPELSAAEVLAATETGASVDDQAAGPTPAAPDASAPESIALTADAVSAAPERSNPERSNPEQATPPAQAALAEPAVADAGPSRPGVERAAQADEGRQEAEQAIASLTPETRAPGLAPAAGTPAAEMAEAGTPEAEMAGAEMAGAEMAEAQIAAAQTAETQVTEILSAPPDQTDDATGDATVDPAARLAMAEDVPTAFMVRGSGEVELLDRAPPVVDNVVIDSISYSALGDVLIAGRAARSQPSPRLRIYLDNRPIAVATAAGGDWASDLPDVDPGVYTLRVDQLSDEGRVVSRFETPFQREDPGLVVAAQAQAAALEPALEQVPPPEPVSEPGATPVAGGGQPSAGAEQPASGQTGDAVLAASGESGVARRAETGADNAASGAGGGVPPVSLITVQPGHTLWAISDARYGAGELYVVIYRANRDQIRNPDLIYPGQVFTLPDNQPPDNQPPDNQPPEN